MKARHIWSALSAALFFACTPIALRAQGSWTFTVAMNTPRTLAAGTNLSDGRVLLASGVDSGGNFLNSAEIYDPATGVWTLTSPMVQPQVGAVAVLLQDGRVLVYGGNVSGAVVTNLAQTFDPASGLWTSTGSMNQCRQSFTGTLLADGQALAVGGYCGGYLDSVEIYDPSTGTWTFTGSLPGPVANASATLLPNGKVLATGGTTGSATNRAELYDPSSGSWTLTGSMNQARAWSNSYASSGTILLNNGQVLAVAGGGGSGCGSVLSSSELYDPSVNTWTFTGSLSSAFDANRLVLLDDGRVLAAGGLANNCATALNTAQIYDATSGVWSPLASLNQGREQLVAFTLLDGRVLVAGGDNSSGTLNTAEIFNSATAFISMGPQAMEGNLTLNPGATVRVGYDFTMPGTHSTATVSFIGAQVAFASHCVSGQSSGSFVVPIAGQNYTAVQNSSAWYPSGNQQSPSVYQGSKTVPDVCSGGLVSFQTGGTFFTGVTSTDTRDKVNVRWHYSGPGSGGSWSATKSVVP